MDNLVLPPIIELSEYEGNFEKYINVLYAVFKHDFIDSKPFFRGKRLGLKKLPIVDGRECTFYHFTHKGNIETERIPDLRRMERIPWPKPIINNSESPSLKVWKNIRRSNGTKTRILIFHEKERYLVVLDERKDFILPWTAYYVSENKKQKLLNEYERYIKAETANNN